MDWNYGHSLIGTYSDTRYQGIWAMGSAYKLPDNGTTTGSLYGLCWSHPNNGGAAGNLNTHGMLVLENGAFLAAISGSIRSRDDMRAPIFYDSSNTAFYVNPESTSRFQYLDFGVSGYYIGPGSWGMRNTTPYGYIEFGPANSSYAHIYTDRSNFYFNAMIQVNGGSQINTSDIRANIFYDQNNTGYYVDAASASVFSDIRGNDGNLQIKSNNVGRNTKWRQLESSTDVGISFYNAADTWCMQLYANAGSEYGFLNGNWASWDIRKVPNSNLYMNSNNTYYLNAASDNFLYRVYGAADIRSPIFYDYNNTAFYTDPNNFSQMSYGNFSGQPSGRTLSLGGDQLDRVYNDAARASLVINATDYPHLYINATTNNGNNTHGSVFSMTGNLTGGGFRRWGMGIANTDPDCWSWGYYDNSANPHYSVGGNFGYTGTGSKMWLNTSGSLWTTGDMRTPIFYDSNNTGYYINGDGYSSIYSLATASAYTNNMDTSSGNVGMIRILGQVGTNWTQITMSRPGVADSAYFFASDSWAPNGNAATEWLGSMSWTGRSLNATGTINASGSDYAEYMTKAGDFTIAKGDICGVDVNGKLTNVFTDAISFVVKSTKPSYVGGDEWGTEEGLGTPVLMRPLQLETETDESYAQRLAEYEIEKPIFDAKLEAARQKVDRIAFSGQVPVNVTGAVSGQYIVPVNDNGAIKGIAVNEDDLTMSQYIKAVGKVIKVVNGKPTIIVKVS
jgi:hypothetical protein